MKFDIYGPFKIELSKQTNLITNESLARLISDVEEDEDGLSDACGCYVFGVRTSKGIVPWYVGQANKSPLAKEALNSTNREKYNSVMFKKSGAKSMSKRTGTPVLFLLPKLTPQGRFAKRTSKENGLEIINFLEEWLIASALQKNPKMINNKNTLFLRNMHVTGLFNAAHGEATKPSSTLKKTLGL